MGGGGGGAGISDSPSSCFDFNLSYDVASGSEITPCNKIDLSYDVASGSEITQCNKIDKPLVVYRFTGNVMTSIITLRT